MENNQSPRAPVDASANAPDPSRRAFLQRLPYVAPVVTTYLVGQAAAVVQPNNPGKVHTSPKPKGPKK